MRIVAGEWRGRPLRAPKGQETRPTSDRVREALFDALGARLGAALGGGAVADLFAGTGALGLEALSRGAARAVFVESAPEALVTLKANVSAMGAGARCTVITGDALSPGVMRRTAAAGPFSLLMADPPYRIDPSAVAAALSGLVAGGALEADGVVVYEHGAGSAAPDVDGTELVRTYRYGDTAVTLYVVC